MSEKKRSEVADVDRSLYDFTKSEEGYERYDDGLTPEIVRAISEKKEEPEWMLQMRLSALETYHQRQMATNWGPSIAGLDLNHISTYVSPKTQQANSWDDVPEDIRDTFDRLGIPQAEAESLAGVGAQYDSEIVYHNMREEVAEQGVIYTTIEDALHDPQWEPVVKEYFGKLIPPSDHKFAALHYAVWSGGSFVYVPKNVTLDYPLQSTHLLLLRKALTCTLLRVAPHLSTTQQTSMQALLSSLLRTAHVCVTRPSKTGPRTCTTSTPSAPSLAATQRWSGSRALLVATFPTSTLLPS